MPCLRSGLASAGKPRRIWGEIGLVETFLPCLRSGLVPPPLLPSLP